MRISMPATQAAFRGFYRRKHRTPTLRPRHRSLIWSAMPLALATAGVGMFRLGHQALSFDESVAVHVAGLPLPAMLRLFTDPDQALHALYDLLLHFWQLGGTSETALRSLSVALGVGTVLVLFALNVRLFDRRTALTSCVLLIVNGFFIRYMQEAWSYSLVMFLLVTATWCFAVAVERPSTSRWIAYAVISAAAVWAHVFAAFVIASHVMSLLSRQPRPPFRLVGASYLITAALVAPLALMMRGADLLGRSFVPLPTGSVERLFYYLTGGGGVAGTGTHLLWLAYFGICCAACIVMIRMENRHRHSAGMWANALVLLWLAVPVLTTFVMSFARPIVDPRSLIVVLPALVTIAGIGISTLPHRALRGLTVAALIVLSAGPLFSYYRTPIREGGDWRAATMYVAEQEHPGDGIVFLPRYGRGPFEYYAKQFGAAGALVPIYPSQSWGTVSSVTQYADSASPVSVAEHLRTVKRVWAFLAPEPFEDTAEDGGPIKRVLEDGYTLVQRREFGPRLEVRLYARDVATSE
jgi:uncharacterized membrane protein